MKTVPHDDDDSKTYSGLLTEDYAGGASPSPTEE